ncbi:MAG: hypothetical protein ACI90G_002653, partial [Urechidicola sp.]
VAAGVAAAPNATGVTKVVATTIARAFSNLFFLKDPSPTDI